ncbi:hypothetical protein L6164_028999 [Bauhinia variegata]|uniref:Uncharacterized protein n=1 Tax=Bauhinia variegata TaxID=167791 RepID=A0ACB9L7F6_BAUVA|nr:hypothetical protein L6164_028999 [Bauhinia variegata]
MSSESQPEKKMITLKSNDGEAFEVEEAVAMQSVTVKNLIELGCTGNTVTLANVGSGVLSKVIEYCKKHVESGNSAKDDFRDWDKKFMEVDLDMLYDLTMAANYLDIKSLYDLTCQTVANMIKGKTADEIRETFNIENDFTPEDEEKIQMENQWVFE